MTVLTTDGWEMQWRRVKRSFAKLSDPYHDTERYDDDIYHFFQDAWHLKEWIKNDPQVPKDVRDNVEDAVRKVSSLCIAGDFANATKHMKLCSKRRKEEPAILTTRKVSITLGDPAEQAVQERVLTLSNKSEITAEAVATEVMQAWESLLGKFGLVTRG